jgi:hypothetical protein
MLGAGLIWILLLPPISGSGTINEWERVGSFKTEALCQEFRSNGLEQRRARGFLTEAVRFEGSVCAQFEKKEE